jgi:GDP-mannose 6-dehydrogenase
MRISVFGLGYVGCISAACLADDGHRVIGVDVNPDKVDLVRRGVAPIVERGVGQLLADNVANGRLSASTNVAEAISETNMSLICVGTPSQFNGNLDLSHVRRVCEEIGAALRTKSSRHWIVIRSTMLPGATRSTVIPTLEQCSGKRVGVDFEVCVNPEFLREGSAVADCRNPPKTIIGETAVGVGDPLVEIYAGFDAPLIRTSIEVAEMVKYADNSWHALKVGFANEIGNLCKANGIDSHKVMDIFCQDTKLNLSAAYLRPGFAFGGSCLPKDVRALTSMSRRLDVPTPILDAILPSNRQQIQRGAEMVLATGRRRVGILGFSFKAGTDDLRESPLLDLIEYLIGKGLDLRIYDSSVNMSTLIGRNRDHALNQIPHIARIMVQSINEIFEHAEVVVVGNAADEFRQVLKDRQLDQIVIDLVRLLEQTSVEGRYVGICW